MIDADSSAAILHGRLSLCGLVIFIILTCVAAKVLMDAVRVGYGTILCAIESALLVLVGCAQRSRPGKTQRVPLKRRRPTERTEETLVIPVTLS